MEPEQISPDANSSGSGGPRAIGTILQLLVYAVAAAVVSLIVWAVYTLVQRGPQARADVAAARDEGPRLMQTLSIRPEAVAVGPRKERFKDNLRHGHASLTESQMFDAPGTYSDAVDDYVNRLGPEGWRVLERSAHNAHLAKGRWDLRIDEHYVSELPPPSCRYLFVLVWKD